jgi:hypothetical protein
MIQLTIYDQMALTFRVATASIPFLYLRKGLRGVKLFDASNTRSGAFDFAYLSTSRRKPWHRSSLSGIEPPFATTPQQQIGFMLAQYRLWYRRADGKIAWVRQKTILLNRERRTCIPALDGSATRTRRQQKLHQLKYFQEAIASQRRIRASNASRRTVARLGKY